MSTYLEELATLAAKIGDDNAKATLDLGWIGPQERDALVDAAQQAGSSWIRPAPTCNRRR